MKIMMTASTQTNNLAGFYFKNLSSLADLKVLPIYTFDIEEKFMRNTFGKAIGRFVPSTLSRSVSAQLMENVMKQRPDLLFIIKGLFISPQVLKRIKSLGIKLVNYNPDHPIVFESPSSGNKNIQKSLRYYDVIYTYSHRIADEVRKKHPDLDIRILPFGYEKCMHCINPLEEIGEIDRVCFVGVGDEDRCTALSYILKSGYAVDVYGNGYDALRAKYKSLLQIYPPVYGNNYYSVLQSYKVQLNLLRRQNRGSHNMRTFEIPSVGGIQITEYSMQAAEFFKDRNEIFLYRNCKEMLNQIDLALNLSENERIKFRNAARERCDRSGYSYRERSEHLAGEMMLLIN